MIQDTSYQAQQIHDSWLPTSRLTWFATHWYTYPVTPYSGTDLIAETIIAGSVEEAVAYYESLDEEQAREEAAEALAAGGWDMHRINFKLS